MDIKNYLVVGGSSGIGLEITKQLSDKKHHIWVAARNSESIPKANNIHFFPFDVLKGELDKSDLPETLNGMVYCPGTINLKPFRQLKKDDFLNDLNINFLGAVQSIQNTLSLLRKSESTSSIVLFSTVAVQTGLAYHASIAGAKGAVEGLTRSLAAEFAPNIRVNCIAPSLTNTPLAERLLSTEDKRKASGERHPLKRFGQPHEIAEAACFLLDDQLSWMTGQVLHLDGGMSSVRLF